MASTNTRATPRASLKRGVAFLSTKNFGDAIHEFTDAIETAPEMGAAYRHRAVAYLRQGSLAEALNDFDRAVSIGPPTSGLFYLRGNARQQHGDTRGALSDYETALRLEPGHVNAFNARETLVSRLSSLSPGNVFPHSPPKATFAWRVWAPVLIGGFVGVALFSYQSGFSEDDIKATKESIRTELSNRPGVRAVEVQLLRESKTKLVGYAKMYMRGLGVEITKSCSATMSSDSQKYLWRCE